MDTFASIALATNGNRTTRDIRKDGWYPEHTWADRQGCSGRPSKRARSEKLPSPEMGRLNVRPVTSYAQSAEDRRLEAELLLNFSREACFTVPRAPATKTEIVSPSLSHSAPEKQSTEQHAPALSPYQPVYTLAANLKQDGMDGNHTENHQLESGVKEQTTKAQSPHDGTGVGLGPAVTEHDQPESSTQPPCIEPTANDNQAAAQLNSISKDDGQDTSGGSAEHVVECRTTDPSAAEHKDLTPSGALAGLGSGNDPDSDRPSQSSLDVSLPDAIKEATEDTARDQDMGNEDVSAVPMDSETGVLQLIEEHLTNELVSQSQSGKSQLPTAPSICVTCNFTRNTLTAATENDATSWISCDACKAWFHFACAGFRNEREVRSVDKFRCRKCKPVHGGTTYVRKSARAHSAIDYAGLNEGVLKTSDENPEHHYIKPIKEGTIKFNPETFARMRPEFVTLEYFQRGDGMKEPIVIPASLNPRPHPIYDSELGSERQDASKDPEFSETAEGAQEEASPEQWLCEEFDNQEVPDYGQDGLDMVIPQNLTVRTVSELYGPDMPVEVIDVKSQNGEDKKWDMRRWVDYYESKGDKVVRNVISLEVSQSKLGRLIKRPLVVRDLDLQDHVWPGELQAKGDFPKVQFYCLMSVADCFTDFHIDFGGSSVFYHILKGKKTFFFIPPHEKHLKKYEEWCMSPAQNWTFLGDQTKECYRVDLSEGDTMLIPAGWIHAVWTPEDSLVIGGNFLTNMHYEMQIRVAQIEKVTGVARKFRYPHFQKLLWFAAMKYLEEDPVPKSVTELLLAGQTFPRETATHLKWDAWGEDSEPGLENYHARYYSKAELDGLPELGRYLLRTALIAMGSITDGISIETRNAVKRSIPKGNGEPLDIVKQFAVWYSWKRGNENVPHWAYPDYVPECKAPELGEKKLSVAALKRLDREAAIQAWRIVNDRQSARRRSLPRDTLDDGKVAKDGLPSTLEVSLGAKRKLDDVAPQEQSMDTSSTPLKKRKTAAGGGTPVTLGPACETCRKRRRACKHREGLPKADDHEGATEESINIDSPTPAPGVDLSEKDAHDTIQVHDASFLPTTNGDSQRSATPSKLSLPEVQLPSLSSVPKDISQTSPISAISPKAPSSSGRAKACNDCRKSKVCVLFQH
jgi:F-box/leucine-rich repeat protein 10/11